MSTPNYQALLAHPVGYIAATKEPFTSQLMATARPLTAEERQAALTRGDFLGWYATATAEGIGELLMPPITREECACCDYLLAVGCLEWTASWAWTWNGATLCDERGRIFLTRDFRKGEGGVPASVISGDTLWTTFHLSLCD